MIRSPRLAARRVHGDAVHDGNWVPILDTDEHAAVLATLNARSSPTRRTVPRHLLTGLVVCGLCGGHLKTIGFRMHNVKHFGRYQCVKQPGMVNCGGVAVAKDSLDRFVINEVLRFLVGFNLRPMPDDRRQDALEREVAEDERALVELTQARFYERTISQEEYGPARQSLQERLAANRAALEAMERQREALPTGLRPGSREDLDAWWEDASLEEQRRALAHILDCVRVNRAPQLLRKCRCSG